MERKTSYLIIILLAPFLVSASYKTRIYQAYISNNMQAWQTAMDEMENKKTSENAYLAELLNYQYGYIGYCLGVDEDKAAEKYLDLAEDNLDKLEDQRYSPGTIAAYRCAFYGYKIGLSPMKAPFLGPKSIKAGEEAIKTDPQNPLGFVQLGNAQFHMPAVFGGSKKEAIEYFQKAEKLMEAKPETWVNGNWNYLSLLTKIGQSYEEMKEYKQAEIYYRKALSAEPGFKWVKDELLPNLEKTMNDE